MGTSKTTNSGWENDVALHVGEGLFAEGFEAGLFEGVAVEHVVGVEGDEALGVGVGDVDAGFLDGAEIEGLGVDELDDEDAEEIVVAEALGGEDLGEAAEEFAQGAGLRLRASGWWRRV